MTGTLIKRTISLAGRRTSVALEAEFWAALKHIAASHQETLTALVAEADARRPEGRPLASALRVRALQTFLPTAVRGPDPRQAREVTRSRCFVSRSNFLPLTGGPPTGLKSLEFSDRPCGRLLICRTIRAGLTCCE